MSAALQRVSAESQFVSWFGVFLSDIDIIFTDLLKVHKHIIITDINTITSSALDV